MADIGHDPNEIYRQGTKTYVAAADPTIMPSGALSTRQTEQIIDPGNNGGDREGMPGNRGRLVRLSRVGRRVR